MLRLSPGERDCDWIPNPKAPGSLVYHVLAEHHLAITLPIRCQSAEWLLPSLTRRLVGGGEHATSTGFHYPESDSANLEPTPTVLIVGLATGHYEIGAEPIHRKRLGQPAVEIGQRLFGNKQKGKAIGKAHSGPRGSEYRVGRTHRILGHMDQAAFAA